MTTEAIEGYAIFGTSRGLSFTGAGLFGLPKNYTPLFEYRPDIEEEFPGWGQAIVARTLFSDTRQRYISIAYLTPMADKGGRPGYIGHAVIVPATVEDIHAAIWAATSEDSLFAKFHAAQSLLQDDKGLPSDFLDDVKSEYFSDQNRFGKLSKVNAKSNSAYAISLDDNQNELNKTFNRIARFCAAETFVKASDCFFFVDNSGALPTLSDNVVKSIEAEANARNASKSRSTSSPTPSASRATQRPSVVTPSRTPTPSPAYAPPPSRTAKAPPVFQDEIELQGFDDDHSDAPVHLIKDIRQLKKDIKELQQVTMIGGAAVLVCLIVMMAFLIMTM